MQITYKKIPKLVIYCGDCGHLLYGKNGNKFPYTCKCGGWEGGIKKNYKTGKVIYILKKPNDSNSYGKTRKNI